MMFLALAQLKAQNINNGSWWFDGYANYSMSISGQFVNMFGERIDGDAIQGLLKRMTKTDYTVLPIGEGFKDVPFRAKSGWKAEHIVFDGKEYLVMRNKEGNAVWTLAKHDFSYNLNECVIRQREYEEKPVEELLDTYMMNARYLSHFTKYELDGIRHSLQKRLMTGQGLSVIGQTNLQMVISELQLSDYMRHGVRTPEIMETEFGQRIVVKNEKEFLDALGSDREILLDMDVVINVTKMLEDPDFGKKANRLLVDDVTGEVDADQEAVVGEQVFDGRQLVLTNMRHLAIRGLSGSMLYAEPRYSFVLSLNSCEDIMIDNLILGHSFEGYCDGGVINVENSRNVVINSCDLFGCGTYGICTRQAEHVTLMNSLIRHCTYGIAELNDSRHLTFYNCDIFANKEFSLFNSWGNEDVIIDSCRFFSNWPESPLFNMNHPITMGDNMIAHPMQNWGTTDLIETGYSVNKWFDGNYKLFEYQGKGPMGITKWEDLLVPNHEE